MPRRHNNKGRSRGKLGPFVPIPYPMAHSQAWRDLSGPSVKVYVELRSRYNGYNNGDLSLSYAEAAKLLGLSKSTVKRAFDELTEKGFLIRQSQGQWYGRKAATWASTDETVDVPRPGPATKAWKDWEGNKN